jgi:hypothetical protein
MERISGFLDNTDRSDMSLVVCVRNWLSGHMAKHEIKFGKGWMGRNAGIKYVRHRYTGNLKGVHILVSVASEVTVWDCWLKSSVDRIHLGRPTDISEWNIKSDALMDEEEDEDEEYEEFGEPDEAESERVALWLKQLRLEREAETDEERLMREYEEKVRFNNLLVELDREF